VVPFADDGNIDLIRELRLRQWARRNFVPPEMRRATWHPIVLSEMAFRDQELAESETGWTMIRTPFVPLAPTDFSYRDEAHGSVPAPMMRPVSEPMLEMQDATALEPVALARASAQQ